MHYFVHGAFCNTSLKAMMPFLQTMILKLICQFDWLEVRRPLKATSRFSMTENGVIYVVQTGT